jgi:transposase
VQRQLKEQGYDVRLMSPEYVRPYVKAQKNDDRDAEAIAEAATRPTMRFVALKTEAQLDVQLLHRVRDRLVGQTHVTHQPNAQHPTRAGDCRGARKTEPP